MISNIKSCYIETWRYDCRTANVLYFHLGDAFNFIEEEEAKIKECGLGGYEEYDVDWVLADYNFKGLILLLDYKWQSIIYSFIGAFFFNHDLVQQQIMV